MAMAPGPVSSVMLLLISTLTVMPLVGPPLPLDPKLAAIAPPECIWYATSAGFAEANPNSTNQTEQLLAEPEVRHFATSLEDQLLRIIRRSSGSGQKQRILATEVPKLVKAVITRPMAMFVEDFRASEAGFEIEAGFVLNVGEKRAEVETAIQRLVELATADGVVVENVDLGGGTWSTVKTSTDAPEIRWGWRESYFIVAVGEGTADRILQRISGTAPGWLDELRRDQPFERESTLSYLNVNKLIERLRPKLEQERAWGIVEKLGLTNLASWQRQSGFDQQGCVRVAGLQFDGPRRGLLELLPDKRLSDNDLAMIPAEVTAAFAARFDLNQTWKDAIRLIEEFHPREAEHMERELWELETEIGVNVRDDLLGSLDDVWTAYMPSGDLMSAWLGSAAAVKVKDGPRLQESVKKLVAYVQANQPRQGRRGIKISDSQFEGETVYTLNAVGNVLPISPSWCVTDDWLIVGLTPQTVRSMLTRPDEQSLADVDEVRRAFDQSQAPTAITYVDTPKLVSSLYPLLQMGAQALSSQLARDGIEIDVTIMPSVNTIVKHLRPSVATYSVDAEGCHWITESSLPMGNGLTAFAPVLVGSLVPAVGSARTAAQRAQTLNNMKQIALAFHNYEASYGKFPTNIYDDQGNALLSWRVRLLPFMEQQALYDRFHLDEPWDSPHNKHLSETIVPFFSSPNAPPSNKTRYLTLAHKDSIFPGDEELSFRNVVDGTSYTILFVEAAPNTAVVWSQPKDIDFDTERPFTGIQTKIGQFAVAFTDGSCRWLNLSNLEEEMMRALMTKAGGEVIEPDVLGR